MNKKQREYQLRKTFGEDEDGYAIVVLRFSYTTMLVLDRLSELGIYGMNLEDVCEGFVYRGLQATTVETEGT